ncbi:MAG: hypothetical protein AAF212_07555, partial [Verrucomicrobiota bacterium]
NQARFRFRADFSGTGDELYIDNISIEGFNQPTISEPAYLLPDIDIAMVSDGDEGIQAEITISELVSGRTYVLESSTDLGINEPWSEVQKFSANPADEGLSYVFIEPDSALHSFFRVKVEITR